jgi:hypothetical protein
VVSAPAIRSPVNERRGLLAQLLSGEVVADPDREQAQLLVEERGDAVAERTRPGLDERELGASRRA